MTLQGQGPDPSERILADLRSKNDEVKYKAAGELRDLITLLSRGTLNCSDARGLLTLVQNGLPSASAPSTTKLPTASLPLSSRHPMPATKWEVS